MKLQKKNSPTESKILLLLGMEGLDKKKVFFNKTDTANMFIYDLWSPLKKRTIDYIKQHCKLQIKEVAWMSKKGWMCYYIFSS